MKITNLAGSAAAVLAILLTAASAEGSAFRPAPQHPRKIVIGGKPAITLCKDGIAEFEVVKPANPAAAPAAKELIERLAQITGKKVEAVKTASGKVPAFYLGVCPEAEKLGLDPEKLDRDGFYIKTDGNKIFITGCDSRDPRKVQRATLFGVYDFLERFAGVRYYFPGEIGTVVPQKKNWTLPEIDITERPDTQYRWIYVYPNGKLGGAVKYRYPGMKDDNPLIWRNSTLNSIRSCHGLNDLELVKRFAKTNPEFFAMTAAGDRHDGSKITTSYQKHGHLCYSSEGLKEVIYQDAAACLTGKPASSRGISRWSPRWNTLHVDLAPNDGMLWCQCPKCKKIQEQGRQAMSNHIWGFAADIASRLKKNGIPGYVMMESYGVFSRFPTIKIPDNVMIGAAITGPWGMNNEKVRTRDAERLEKWSKTAGAKIRTWAYITKAVAAVPVVPGFTPRAVGAFYKSVRNWIFGGFVEAGSDRWMYGFLNCYVASKVLWNFDTDVEALIDEHCRLMYGPAAEEMKAFYAELENIWMNSIVKEVVDTPWGENWKIPTRHEVWTKIYSPAKIAEIDRLFDQAEKAASGEPEALKRLKFMRNELWQPVIDGAKAFQAETANRTAWTLYAAEAGKITFDGKLNEQAWKNAEAVWLNANRPGQKTEVQTRVKMLKDEENFYFGFEADEPETERMIAFTNRKPGSTEIWRDNGGEIFLSAGVASEFIYQFIFNSAGCKADLRNTIFKTDASYESGFDVKTSVIPGRKWTAEVRIPRKAVPELAGKNAFVGNFTRHRVLKDTKVGTEYYAWFPKLRNIAENCGIIRLDRPEKEKNIVRLGDFDYPVHGKRHMGTAWSAVGKKDVSLTVDHEIFMTRGVSVRLEPDCPAIRQTIPVEPDRQYKISFFVRTENLTPGLRIMIRYGGDPAPSLYVLGDYRDYIRDTVNWYRVEKIFRTPKTFGTQYKPHLEFFIGSSTGKCWIDHVEIVEVK
ncbi:MAG: DUF4838 domain-containing protein [Lentisphaeria bacterium]|nr:DUF4838 domain-containing protein [Lentisphaeria bacterium]